ncbi:hypothetical protein BD413DRAFT_617015 [Trametes elegans]|nr:hypothetical protein BD413DRAFT_617015 [Trametes elegans]
MSLVCAHQPLFTKTNAPRLPNVHFKLPVLKKSAPTVSVTNTNAARSNTSGIVLSTVQAPASSVPFPSAPIPCPPPRKRSVSEDGYVMVEDDMQIEDETPRVILNTSARQVSRTDITPVTPDKPQALPEKEAKRVTGRRESMSAGNSTPTGKTIRKTRRALADAQFLASLHSSIASHVRARMDVHGEVDDYTTQDALLVDRIWRTLVDMGYKPVPLDAGSEMSPPSTLTPSPSIDVAREAAERAARRTMSVSTTHVPPDLVQGLPLAPMGTLPMPQLMTHLPYHA